MKQTAQTPARTTLDGIPVYCRYDEIRKTVDLQENPQNPNHHPEDQIERLAEIIRGTGWRAPITVSTLSGLIVKGHGRLAAAKKAGFSEVPVELQHYDTPEQEKADLIADNRIAELADLNQDDLKNLLSELESANYDMAMTGYNSDEIDAMFADSMDLQEDEDFDIDAELSKPAFSRDGDIWTLGRHRLICGDSTDSAVTERLMGNERANLCITDPPYNVDYSGKSARVTQKQIENDHMENGQFYDFLAAVFRNIETALRDDASIYVFHADTEGRNFRAAFADAGFYLSGTCIWVKNTIVLGRSPYQWQHEPCLFGWKAKGKHLWFAGRKETTVWELDDDTADAPPVIPEVPTTVWRFDKPAHSRLHPTMKPIPLLQYPLKNSSKRGDLILDPFGGSGSTLMACEQSGRACYTIELDPKFVDVIVRRYVAHAGPVGVSLLRGGTSIPYASLDMPNE